MRRWEVQSYKLSKQSGYTIDLRKMEAALLRRKKFSCQREVVSCKIRSPRDTCLCQYVSSYSSLICYLINGKISVVTYSPQRCMTDSLILLRKSGKNNKRKVRKRACCKVRSWQRMRRHTIFRKHFYAKRKRCIFKHALHIFTLTALFRKM